MPFVERRRRIFELLNRFDQIVHFRQLTRGDIHEIALRELRLIEQRPGMSERGLRLEVDDAVLDWLTTHGYDPLNGARYLHRTLERHVTHRLLNAW